MEKANITLFFFVLLFIYGTGCIYQCSNPLENQSPPVTYSNPEIPGSILSESTSLNTTYQNINLDTAYSLAESYARTKYPEFWNESPGRTVKNVLKSEMFHGSMGKDFIFRWKEFLVYPDKNTLNHYEITGPGSISIIMNTSGKIKIEQSTDSFNASSETVDLVPTITEEQAWNIALQYYGQRGMRKILPSEKKSMGLWIWDDSWNDLPWPKYGKQYLAWVFDVSHKQNYTMGGTIMVDAHDGHIINLNEIM